MFKTGERVVYVDRDAVVLTSNEEEVLIYIDMHYIKWVDAGMIRRISEPAYAS